MRIALSFLLLLCFGLGPADVYGQGKHKNIVIFCASNESIPGYKSILDGFQSGLFKESGDRYNLLIEYLDLERFPNSNRIKELVALYNNRFYDVPVDLVMTVGSGAFNVLKDYGLGMLDTCPLIAMEIGQMDTARYAPNKHVFEIQVMLSPSRTLAHAFELFPDRTEAVLIGGCSFSDRQYNKLVTAEARQFEGTHTFKDLTCMSFDSVLHIVGHLEQGSMAFLISYAADQDGIPFSTSLALQALSKVCAVPLFTMTDNFIEHGGIGGDVISFYEAGNKAGTAVHDMINHHGPQAISVLEGDFYRHQYNWKEIEKWGLTEARAIPPDSTFYQKEVDFFARYKWQIMGVILFVILQTLLIVYLIRLIRNQKNVYAQQVRNEEVYRHLLREERMSTMAVLTASLSHELNQPLAAILFSTQAGLKYLETGRLNETQSKSILTDIETDVKRASGIISSVRSYLQFESRKRENLNMTLLIREVLQILHAELVQQQVRVTSQDTSSPTFVSGNKIELQQVLINLILNAVKAMKDMEPEQKHIDVVSAVKSKVLSIFILDNGPGIPEQMLGHVFDAFHTTRADGLGIGLTLCKAIITQHGGTILAQNRKEGGAEFIFTLPLVAQ